MTCNFKNIFLSVFATLNLLAAAQPDDRNKEALVTLTAPVEIQGVVLPAGGYLFKLVDDDSSHQTIQIFNGEQSEPVAVFPAVPADDEEDDVDDPDIESEKAPDLPSQIVVIPPDDEDDDYECAPQEDDDGTITLTATAVADTGGEATEESADDVNGATAQLALPAPRL